MSDATARQPQSISVEAVVLRCMCGNPDSHTGQPCPQAQDESLGTVAYWHRNPVRRLLWHLRQRIAKES